MQLPNWSILKQKIYALMLVTISFGYLFLAILKLFPTFKSLFDKKTILVTIFFFFFFFGGGPVVPLGHLWTSHGIFFSTSKPVLLFLQNNCLIRKHVDLFLVLSN